MTTPMELLPEAEIIETVLVNRKHAWLLTHPERNRIVAAMIAAARAAGRLDHGCQSK